MWKRSGRWMEQGTPASVIVIGNTGKLRWYRLHCGFADFSAICTNERLQTGYKTVTNSVTAK